jgi:hypothetical protein
LCSLESQELELTALKPLEDGEGYLLRLADRHGAGGEGILTWMGQPFTVVCKPYEVRAFRIERLEDAWDLFPCDFLERPYRSHDV